MLVVVNIVVAVIATGVAAVVDGAARSGVWFFDPLMVPSEVR